MPFKLVELRSKSDEELIEEHDRRAENVHVGINYFLDELARRDTVRQPATIRRLTWVIAGLTLVNVVATTVAVAQ